MEAKRFKSRATRGGGQNFAAYNFTVDKFRTGKIWGVFLKLSGKFGIFSGAHLEIYEKQRKWRRMRKIFWQKKFALKKKVGFFKTVRKIWWELLVTKFVHRNLSGTKISPVGRQIVSRSWSHLRAMIRGGTPSPSSTDQPFTKKLRSDKTSGRWTTRRFLMEKKTVQKKWVGKPWIRSTRGEAA